LLDAAYELAHGLVDRNAGRLRQLRNADEVLRIELRKPIDQVVAVLRPRLARRRVAEMVAHPARTRAEDRDVRAALALQLQLRALDALAQLVVADLDLALDGLSLRVLFEVRLLLVAIVPERFRRGGVVAVAVDDHLNALTIIWP